MNSFGNSQHLVGKEEIWSSPFAVQFSKPGFSEVGRLFCAYGFAITFLFFTSTTLFISTPCVWKSAVHLETGVLGSLGTVKCHLNVYQPALPCSWCSSSGLTQSASLQDCYATCWSRFPSSWSIPNTWTIHGKSHCKGEPTEAANFIKEWSTSSSHEGF